MAKKTTAKKKTSRLGHDPFDDSVLNDGDNISLSSQEMAKDEEPIETKADDADEILCLPSHFSIAAVEEVHAQMSSILNREQETIEIDAGEVEAVDTAAIQMLYAFIEQTKTSGKTLQWKRQSEKIAQASSMLNINIFDSNG